ncbi:MAG: Ig-like domain-containing protein, partial [Clostridia bacterium]|nr:Ig-like domain-containing protein [Clostridia bacterium]
MKKNLKLLSLFLSVVLLFSFVSIGVQAEWENEWIEFEKELHSAEYWLEPIEETVFFASDDYAKYSYIVKDGEASIVNFHITYQGDEKIEFVLPTTLGGYPVTAIGYEYDDGRGIDATWYIHYGEDTFEKYPEYLEYESYPEWDPGLDYISKLVIPEGYKTIYHNSLYAIGCSVSFPKSLRKISGKPFDWYLYTHVDENGEKYTVLPECQYDTDWKSVAFGYYGDVYFPSRLGSEWLLNNLQFYPGTLYIPSNYSYEAVRNALFGREWDEELDMPALMGDPDKGYGEGTIIHCAPDSEFLRIFNEHTILNYYTFITDVVPAEYIEFPEETVNVCVGDVVDLEAKTYPAEAVWTACDYTVSDPSIVKIDEYSGRITALKEGTVTVTATHCERGYVDTCIVNVTTKPEPGVNGIEPATDTPYVTYGNRDYKINVTGSPSKIQVVRDNGGTTTIDRRKAQVTS